MDQCAQKAAPMPYDEALEAQPDLYSVEVSPPPSPYDGISNAVWAEAFSEAADRLERVPTPEEIEDAFDRMREGPVVRLLIEPYHAPRAPGWGNAS